MAENHTIRNIEDKIQDLPLVDVAVLEILSLLNNLDSNFQQIVEKLSPEVAAKFLNMANSAYYGTEVRTIDYAVRVLGYSGMKQILAMSVLIDHFSKYSEKTGFNFDSFQKNAQACAVISRALGEILDYSDPAELFTVSMLHNIGELIIALYFEEEQEKINVLKSSENVIPCDAERRIIGLSHGEIGGLVLKRFQLSQDICDAVKYHDLEDRIIPGGSNFQMELITKVSAALMDRVTVSDDLDPSAIADKLKETVTNGKDLCREKEDMAKQAKVDADIFHELLNSLSALVYEDLKRIFPE